MGKTVKPIVKVVEGRVKEREAHLHYYEIRHSDRDVHRRITVEKDVLVNFWGTVITNFPIQEIEATGYLTFKDFRKKYRMQPT